MPDTRSLLNRSFEKASFGGYKTADVDSFMAELSTALSQSGREVTELKRKLEATEKKLSDYENEEESLKSTLLRVQRLADKIKKEAEEKAGNTISEAKTEAEAMIQNAKIEAESLIDGAQGDIEMRKNEADRIKKEVSKFKLSVMRLYKAQLELINKIPAEEPSKQDEQVTAAVQNEPQPEADAQEAAPAVQEAEQSTQEAEPVEPSEPSETSESADSAESVDNNIDNSPEKLPEQPEQKSDTIVFSTSSDTCEFVLGTHGSKAGKVSKADEAGGKVKSPAKPQRAAAMPQKQRKQSRVTEQTEREASATDASAQSPAPAVRLNLRYNEKTGEYEPFGVQPQDEGSDEDGIKFGSDYNLRTDSFNDSESGSGHRAPWRK